MIVVDANVLAYFFEYVYLAQSMGIQLVTEDGPLRKAFPDTAVSMAAFLSSHPRHPPAVREPAAAYPARRRKRPGA